MKLRCEFSTTNASWHGDAQLCFLMEFLLEQTHTAPALCLSMGPQKGREDWEAGTVICYRHHELQESEYTPPNSCSDSEHVWAACPDTKEGEKTLEKNEQARDCVQNTICLFCLSFSKMKMKDSSSCVLFCFHCHFLCCQEGCLLQILCLGNAIGEPGTDTEQQHTQFIGVQWTWGTAASRGPNTGTQWGLSSGQTQQDKSGYAEFF